MTPGSDFTEKGLPIGNDDVNMTYLYGISDFFSTMFEDPSRINLILEATSQGASEVYSKFLQLTSTLSLDDIQNTIGSQIKLITVKSSDAVAGEINTYSLSVSAISAKYIANRPLLPTTLLEEGADFRLEVQADGSAQIRFAKAIGEAGFSTRLLSDGVTKEYAMWFVDVEIDERLVSKIYGERLGLNPNNSTEIFRNYVYGLYFTYIHGPTLDDLRKGLNLVLGIPLARDVEQVLDIRTYLDTDQYIVIGEKNEYLVPYGLPPIVKIGDQLKVGDEIAQWVEIKDYRNDGEWWVNLYIPESIIPDYMPGQPSRYALKGTYYDQLMRNYMKTHTFLVNVKVEAFKGIENFQALSDILYKARPLYTRPIYVWSVNHTETIDMTEDIFQLTIQQFRSETLMNPIGRMVRKNQPAPLSRNEPIFLRWSMNKAFSRTSGQDEFINGDAAVFNQGPLTGYLNPVRQFRNNTDEERAAMTTVFTRGAQSWRSSRSHMGFYRNTLAQDGVNGIGVNVKYGIPEEMRMVPLYMTKQVDLHNKCESLGLETPPLGAWVFDLLNPMAATYEINSSAFNEQNTADDALPYILRVSYGILFQRGSSTQYLGSIIPEIAYETWTPDLSDLRPNDYLLGVRIFEDLVGLYWITSNQTIDAPFVQYSEEPDPLKISFNAPLTRNSNGLSNPFYFIRGRGLVSYNRGNIDEDTIDTTPGQTVLATGALNASRINLAPINTKVSVGSSGETIFDPSSPEINGDAINEARVYEDNVFNTIYSDMYNVKRPMTRGGTRLVHVMEV